MHSINEIKEIIGSHKKDLQDTYGISTIGIFGSYVRGEQVEGSDIDVLVELETRIGFF